MARGPPQCAIAARALPLRPYSQRDVTAQRRTGRNKIGAFGSRDVRTSCFEIEALRIMMLWIIFAVMTAAAVFAVLWPLGRKPAGSAGSDQLVYQDQLQETERDRAVG